MNIIELFETTSTYPTTWYHGSNYQISKFSRDFINVDTSNGLEKGPGIYFTSDIDDAKIYGKNVYEVKIRIVTSRLLPEFKRDYNMNLLINHAITGPHSSFHSNYRDWDDNKSKAAIKAFKTFMQIYNGKHYKDTLIRLWEDFYFNKSSDFLKDVVGKYDGFILDYNNGIKHFVCFKPEIIKSFKLVDLESHQSK